MKVLGIDTSGYANAIGVSDGDRISGDAFFEAKTDSLEKIVSNIDYVLKEAGLCLGDIQGIGVGLGPGSWTGIRVGVTVGKVLAYSTGKPVCGIPTLKVLAYSAGDTSALVCPVIYAGTRDTVYAAFYRRGEDMITREGEYYVGSIAGLIEMINEPAIMTGSGAEAYRHLFEQKAVSSGFAIEVVESGLSGAMVARLAARRFGRGESDDALSLEPLYLKESTARAFVSRYSAGAQAKGEGG